MKLIKLFSLAILFFSINTVIVSAQENEVELPREDDTYNINRLNEINEAYKLIEMQRNMQLPLAQRNRKMSKEQEEKILTKLHPEIKIKMEEIKKLDKDKYYRLLNSITFGIQDMLKYPSFSEYLASPDKKNLEKEKLLEIEVQLLTLKYKNADKSSKSMIKKDLTAALSEMFDIREAQKQKEVELLKKRLQELNESLKARKQNKNIIIERRIQELLGDSKYLEW